MVHSTGLDVVRDYDKENERLCNYAQMFWVVTNITTCGVLVESSLAQWLARLFYTQKVMGSKPIGTIGFAPVIRKKKKIFARDIVRRKVVRMSVTVSFAQRIFMHVVPQSSRTAPV